MTTAGMADGLPVPWRWRRWALRGLLVTLVLFFAAALWVVRSYGAIASGFFAKGLCSGVFVAGRDALSVVDRDLRVYPPGWVFRSMRWSIDVQEGRVDAWLSPMLGSATVRYRGAQGCALLPSGAERAAAGAATLPVAGGVSVPDWPATEGAAAPLDDGLRQRLEQALLKGFDEDDALGARRTRAIVVVHRGRLVAERYAEGFAAATPMAGWSMAKSVTAAWVGALVQQGRMRIDEPLQLSAWRASGDPRAALTFRQMLGMASGLGFAEVYDSPFSDVNRMLFFSSDAAGYAARSPLKFPPDTVFNYSSGTTNLISLALRERLGTDYLTSVQRMLFEPLGMSSARMEADASGTLIGSSYLYATARDWARFGQLFLNDGVWAGKRLLPPGWAGYSATRSSASNEYGAHWWLYEPSDKANRDLPAGFFQATGHGGQRVTVIPSKQLVIVRLGLTLSGPALRHLELVKDVIAAIDP